MASGRAPEQEQRDHPMLQIPAHTRNIASSSKEPELDMHKVLSLRRVVEEVNSTMSLSLSLLSLTIGYSLLALNLSKSKMGSRSLRSNVSGQGS